MNKKILYVGGGFDILHDNHKKFIKLGIRSFSNKYGDLSKVIIGLRPDSDLNIEKGMHRPFFSYKWRKEDISNFLKEANIKHTIIPSTDFFKKLQGRNDVVAQVRSDNLAGGKQMEESGITVMYINPINLINTSTFEKNLFEIQKKSNCKLRKVGALLVRQGKIISEGYSGSGDCNCCSKYIAYQKGKGKLSKNVECDYPHAEAVVLVGAKKGDDILITDSPCQKCAELIVSKGIRRVVYVKEYYDTKSLEYLRNNGIKVRKSGV